jgi:hypothetical protein
VKRGEPIDRLEAGGGLRASVAVDGVLRVGWREPDWLGPLVLRVEHRGRVYVSGGPSIEAGATRLTPRTAQVSGADSLGAYTGVTFDWPELPFALRTSVRAYRGQPLLVLRSEAPAAIADLATGAFERPSVAWPAFTPAARVAAGAPEGLRSYGHQWTEFALPVSGDDRCAGYTMAGHRPPVVTPLLFLAPDGRTLLVGPLDSFHEQVIGVPRNADEVANGVRCGWHGDLARVPAGFATELVLWGAPGPRSALDAWCGELLQRNATRRPGRYADDGVGKLSYWTDNGCVYYYRTEPGLDYTATLERVVSSLHEGGVPVRSVQIDSWFYPHENLRPVSDEGAPVVPPTGMLRWEPREDLFPNGFGDLRRRLGGLPLTFHSRHFSRHSPYFDEHEAWTDGDYAHPVDPAFFDTLMAQAASWGAITYEQDWLVESFVGVRGLREEPGRARAWQEGMDRAAARHGLTLQWCMGTPADWLQTVTLANVTSVRTSGDYRYVFDNGLNWVWFLQGNAFARALGLHPYKDVFLTHGETGLGPGERYIEAESLLATLSAGPVGIGDRLGHTDRAMVRRSCRPDGVLVKPDLPIAAVDRCFRANAFLEHVPLIGETHSVHPAGRWWYVATFHASRKQEPLSGRAALADLGALRPAGPVVVWDWRRRCFERMDEGGGWDVALGFQEFDYRVVCPLLPGGITLFGDVEKWATVGDQRVTQIATLRGGLRFDVLGAPGEEVEVLGMSEGAPKAVTLWCPGEARDLALRQTGEGFSHDAASGLLRVGLRVGAQGRTRVRVALS